VVKNHETELFSHVGEGERRVSQVEILDKQSGEYEKLDLSREYTVATLDYLILEKGGSGILGCVVPDGTYYGADIEVLHHYLEKVLSKRIGSEYSTPQGRIIYK
jgi:hypothetical protein